LYEDLAHTIAKGEYPWMVSSFTKELLIEVEPTIVLRFNQL